MNRFMDVAEQHRGMGKDEFGFSIAKKLTKRGMPVGNRHLSEPHGGRCCHAVRALRRDTIVFPFLGSASFVTQSRFGFRVTSLA